MMKKLKLARAAWRRKPQTQVVPNKKALDSKSACRRGKGGQAADPQNN